MKKGSNGHIQREDIMMNLLDDSSETDELNLPPLKGRKQVRRKRNPYSSSAPSGGICNWWQFVKMLVILLLVCAVTVMGFITVWLANQVKDLQQQLNQVKGSSLQTSVEDIQQQIQSSIKKDLVNVTQSSKEMENLKKGLASLSTKVGTLSSSIEAVSQSQPGSKQVVEKVNTISTQIPVISKTVGNLGVDVKSMKSEVEKLKDFQKQVEQELAKMKLQKDTEVVSGGRESGGRESSHADLDPDISNKLQNFGERITLVNNSLWLEIPKLQSTLSSHEVYISALQNITANLQRDLKALSSDHSSIQKDHKMMDQGPGAGADQTKLLIHQVIEDMGLANQSSPVQSVDGLSVKIDNITATVGTLRDQFKMMKDKEEGTNSPDLGTIQTNLHVLNKSVEVLKLDFHTLMNKVSQQSNLLTSLSKTVEVLQHFSAAIDKDHKAMISDAGPTPTASLKTPTERNENEKINVNEAVKTLEKEENVPTTKFPTLSTIHGNMPPVAKTEDHMTVVLPLTEVYLNGTSSTDDKEIILYHWEQTDGPTNLQLTHADEAIATATGNFIAGQYIFELQVWDDESLTSKMKLHVDVRDSNSGEMRSTGYENVRSTTNGPKITATPALHQYIKMSQVKKYEDLEIGVRRWDKDGDGFVNPQDLGDYMPDPPTPQQLEKFDFNHDGLYSIDELAVALGFQPWPKDQPEPLNEEQRN
ncbi:uncharacterized protein LOC111120002 isoform X2 [Crassostrea virginica]